MVVGSHQPGRIEVVLAVGMVVEAADKAVAAQSRNSLVDPCSDVEHRPANHLEAAVDNFGAEAAVDMVAAPGMVVENLALPLELPEFQLGTSVALEDCSRLG